MKRTIAGKGLLVVLLVALVSCPALADRMFEDQFNSDLSAWNEFSGDFVIASRTGRGVLMNNQTSGYSGMYTTGFTPIDVSQGDLTVNLRTQWNAAGSTTNISQWSISSSGDQPKVAGELAYFLLYLRNDPGVSNLQVFAWTDSSGGTTQIVNAFGTTAFNGGMNNVNVNRYADSNSWWVHGSGNSPSIVILSATESTPVTGSRCNQFEIRDYAAGVSEPRYYDQMYIDGFPVPEPATLFVLGAGTLFLSLKRRR